jgi:uncharacterized protein DUF3306
MSAGVEGGLARWSRLKRARTAAVVEHEDEALPPAGPTDGTTAPCPGDPEPAAAAARPALPDITDLDRTSDFTPFLHPEVPEALHRQALRALWYSDPLFAHRDGLTDYDEDYTAIGIVACEVRTAYRAGAGYAEEVVAAPVPDGGDGEGAVDDEAGDAIDITADAASAPSDADAGAASPALDPGLDDSVASAVPSAAGPESGSLLRKAG